MEAVSYQLVSKTQSLLAAPDLTAGRAMSSLRHRAGRGGHSDKQKVLLEFKVNKMDLDSLGSISVQAINIKVDWLMHSVNVQYWAFWTIRHQWFYQLWNCDQEQPGFTSSIKLSGWLALALPTRSYSSPAHFSTQELEHLKGSRW